MSYLKFTPYLYLAAALFFGYDAFDKYRNNEDTYWFGLTLAAVCLFMFFFRRRYAKKFEERRKNGQ